MKRVVLCLLSWGFVAAVAGRYNISVYRVSGNSMMPTIRDGERVFVLSSLLSSVHRFDVVVVNVPEEGVLVKRVAGLPGDHLRCDRAALFVNNEKFHDCFAQECDEFDIVVPSETYFLLGDNRRISVDSRSFGCVPNKNLIGKVLVFEGVAFARQP